MSTRTHISSIISIDQIRNTIASNDESLVKSLVERYENALREEYDGDDPDEAELVEFQETVGEMIKCSSPPKVEPGSWTYVFETLAYHFELNWQDDYSINEDWKHYQIWELYRMMISKTIATESDFALEYLQEGRPLRGSKVEHDGSVFGWLEQTEVAGLHESLAMVDPSAISDPELGNFHDSFVATLKRIKDRNDVLLMGAH